MGALSCCCSAGGRLAEDAWCVHKGGVWGMRAVAGPGEEGGMGE